MSRKLLPILFRHLVLKKRKCSMGIMYNTPTIICIWTAKAVMLNNSDVDYHSVLKENGEPVFFHLIHCTIMRFFKIHFTFDSFFFTRKTFFKIFIWMINIYLKVAKGQIIPKSLFWVFNIFQKMNKNTLHNNKKEFSI